MSSSTEELSLQMSQRQDCRTCTIKLRCIVQLHEHQMRQQRHTRTYTSVLFAVLLPKMYLACSSYAHALYVFTEAAIIDSGEVGCILMYALVHFTVRGGIGRYIILLL